MATTPLWVPLAVAGLAVVGTLAGVVFTQVWNSRLEERRWARENERLRQSQAREDASRTYEHRRAAYVDFLQELERLESLYTDTPREPVDPPSTGDPVFIGLYERLSTVRVYGSSEAQLAAFYCLDSFILAASHPEQVDRTDHLFEVKEEYLKQIRKDLGVPERGPAEESHAAS
jgi:hypothetical protein